MNAPHDPSDPIFQSLAEEAADLPARAAIAARQRTTQRRQTRQRLTLAAVVALLGVVTWSFAPSREKQPSYVGVPPVANATRVSEALPTGLDQEQMEFVKAARDLPLLLVRDGSGKVTRIHLVER